MQPPGSRAATPLGRFDWLARTVPGGVVQQLLTRYVFASTKTSTGWGYPHPVEVHPQKPTRQCISSKYTVLESGVHPRDSAATVNSGDLGGLRRYTATSVAAAFESRITTNSPPSDAHTTRLCRATTCVRATTLRKLHRAVSAKRPVAAALTAPRGTGSPRLAGAVEATLPRATFARRIKIALTVFLATALPVLASPSLIAVLSIIVARRDRSVFRWETESGGSSARQELESVAAGSGRIRQNFGEMVKLSVVQFVIPPRAGAGTVQIRPRAPLLDCMACCFIGNAFSLPSKS